MNARRPLDVSVVIASCNRASILASTLSAVTRLATSGLQWELVVVDNGSHDATPVVLDRYRTQLPLVALAEPQRGKSYALNRALDAARGHLVVFTDDDVRPSPLWLTSLAAASRRRPEYSVLCGPIEPVYAKAPPDWLRDHLFASMAFAKLSFAARREGPLPPTTLPCGPNFAVRASALTGVRFRTDLGPGTSCPLGDETEFLARLRARGHRILYVPSARVEHLVSADQVAITSLLRRAFQIGLGYAAVHPEAWPQMARAWHVRPRVALRWLRRLCRDQQTRFEAAAALCFCLGHATGRHTARLRATPLGPAGA